MISVESVLHERPRYRGSFVDGAWRLSKRPSGQWQQSSPANLDWQLDPVTYAFEDIGLAIAAARAAAGEWARAGLHPRVQRLQAFAKEIEKRAPLLGRLLSFETGKPLHEGLAEVTLLQNRINTTIEYGLALVQSQVIDMGLQGQGEVHWRPLGVLAVLGPFVSPLHFPHAHMVPALLTGNAVIFKPSEKAPYSAQVYMEAAEAAGFPQGVFQLVQGNGETGARLVHDDIDGVLATCTFDVGTKIQSALAERPQKIVALEMGGRNAVIVWKGADLDRTADDLVRSAFMSTGQRCTALSRVYADRDLLPALVKKVHDLAKELVISHPFDEDPKPFMGPLISAVARERFLRYAAIAEGEKCEIIMRPKSLDGAARQSRRPLPQGHYVSPSINVFKSWDPKSAYQTHENLGPDIFFCPVQDLDEGIAAANSTGFGLAFAYFGSSESDFHHVADQVEAGMIYWNRPSFGASARLPFGGWKKSGNHRPSGLHAIFSTVQPQARFLAARR